MRHNENGTLHDGLRLANVNAYYGRSQALYGVDVHVGRSEVACLVGLNGMGKTTILRSIMGLVVTEGGIFLEGHNLPTSTHNRARMGIGYVPEDRRIFPTLAVEENIRVSMRAGRRKYRNNAEHNIGSSKELLELIYDLFPRLLERQRQLAGTLSGGEQQMLALARALAMDPAYLLLDEPNEGLAPAFVETISSAIRELRKLGVGVLLVEQSWQVAFALGDRFYLIERGRAVDHVSREDVACDHDRIVGRLGI